MDTARYITGLSLQQQQKKKLKDRFFSKYSTTIGLGEQNLKTKLTHTNTHTKESTTETKSLVLSRS